MIADIAEEWSASIATAFSIAHIYVQHSGIDVALDKSHADFVDCIDW